MARTRTSAGAALYVDWQPGAAWRARGVLQGKELSYNNLVDPGCVLGSWVERV